MPDISFSEFINTLPTADPNDPGALWKYGDELRISGGADLDTGGSIWTLISATTISSPVANFDVNGLAGYTDIWVYGSLLTTSLSGVRRLFVSTDNGTTFFTTSGDYQSVVSDGTLTNVTNFAEHTTSATVARNLDAVIRGANVLGAPKICEFSGSITRRIFIADNANDINAIRINNSAGNLTGGVVYVWGRAAVSGGGGETALYQDQRASGTDGGAATSGSWLTRTLNTEVRDEIGISLASNQLTVPAGTYDIDCHTMFQGCDRTRTKIRNITDSTDLLFSDSLNLSFANGGGGSTRIYGRITLATAKVLELQYRVQTTKTVNGLGVAASFGDIEIFASLLIQKVF